MSIPLNRGRYGYAVISPSSTSTLLNAITKILALFLMYLDNTVSSATEEGHMTFFISPPALKVDILEESTLLKFREIFEFIIPFKYPKSQHDPCPFIL